MVCGVGYKGLSNASDCMGWDKKFIDLDFDFLIFYFKLYLCVVQRRKTFFTLEFMNMDSI